MAAEIKMPQQTDTMTEGIVVKWVKKEGEAVKAGETIAEIETDKATMEMESFAGGTVAAVLVPEGQKVPVGTMLAVLASSQENPAEIKKQYATRGAAPAAAPAPAPAQIETVPKPRTPEAPHGSQTGVAHSLQAASVGEIHEPANVGHGATREAAVPVPPLSGGRGNGNSGRIPASPLARRIATDKQIDLAQIRGSGPGGRVVQKDVLAYADKPAPPHRQQPTMAVAPRVPRGEKDVVPLTKMRAAIAGGLQKSKQTIPHFYETIDIDVEELSALRGRINKQIESEGIKLSISDFITKAVAAALLRHPAVNAHFTGDSITRYGDVNLGIAVAIPDGLIVPVLRGVDQMGLKEIRVKSEDLVKRARGQKLKQDEMRGATFTVSNLGTFGIREFSAIINPPEVGILAVAAAEKRAVVREDQIVARTMMTVTLSADHRAVDGAVAADFLRTLKSLLEEPGLMLI